VQLAIPGPPLPSEQVKLALTLCPTVNTAPEDGVAIDADGDCGWVS
jgi:hypothetical protein